MSTSVQLGSEVKRGEAEHLVTYRIIRITKQTCLFEDAKGVLSVVTEELLELKDVEGNIAFDVLSSDRTDYEGPVSIIKAPEPITWKRD